MLKTIRLIVSVLCFTGITLFFLDFAGLIPQYTGWLARIQLVPAILSLSIGIFLTWILFSILFGRIYCSSVCPMGIFQDIVARISRHSGKKKKRYRYRKAGNILRWSVLAVVVVSVVAGFPLLLGLVEPYSAYGRMATALFKPLYLGGNNLLESVLTRFDNYTFYKMEVIIHSLSALITGAITFLLIGYLAWKQGRIWCNTICPVGTFLGFLSKYAFFKVRINPEQCTRCGICAANCKASCIDSSNKTVDNSRCVSCFNCLSSCKFDALKYAPVKGKKREKNEESAIPATSGKETTDNPRRQFLLSSMATAAAIPATWARSKADTLSAWMGDPPDHRQQAIMPPGALSRQHFGQHCTSCHLCISKCPASVIKPAWMEYGIGGMMQPTLYFEKGFCNYDCTVCGEVCPNGAIRPLSLEEKHLTQTGYVVFVQKYCIVITDGTSCGACSEHCPTQAVSMIPYRDGLTLPQVDTSICVGCGGCEFICPARPLRAIYVEGHTVQKQRKAFDEGEQKELIIDDFGF